MKTFRWFRVLLGIVAIALLALSYRAGLSTEAELLPPGDEVVQPALTPSQVTAQFYEWYLHYAGDRADGSIRNPLVDGAYRDSAYLTPEFVEVVDELVASFDQGGFDPFLCAQDVPEWMEATEVLREGQRATVEVRSSFVGHAFRVDLQERGGQWLITDVRCK